MAITDVLQNINGRLAWECKLSLLLWLKGREFRGDSNAKLSLVEEGFKDRSAPSADDAAVVSRVAEAYNKAKVAQASADPCYQVSNEWIPIYEEYLREVIQVLRAKNVEALCRIYGNFLRDRCSTGLLGMPVDMHKHYLGGKISRRNKKWYLCDALHRYKLWRSLLGDTKGVDDLASPLIGNPYGYFIDGTFVKAGSDYLHYYATAIGRLVRGDNHRVVVELGGGYGGMAYYLVRDNPGVTYMDFDLPENMALAAYYLLRAFPDRKVLLFGEQEFAPNIVEDYEIVLMPNFELPKMPDNSVNLAFNSYSLAEMSPDAIRTYIAEFTRIVTGYFLHVNHNKVSAVVADDFGVDCHSFDLLYKVPALWNGGRNLDMDEYEYLYRRIGG